MKPTFRFMALGFVIGTLAGACLQALAGDNYLQAASRFFALSCAAWLWVDCYLRYVQGVFRVMGTVGLLRRYIQDMPDDAEFVIEYPERYGRKMMDTVPEAVVTEHHFDGEVDWISGGTVGRSVDKKKLYIFHHY